MAKNRDDPVLYGDFAELKLEFERRISVLETKTDSLESAVTELRADFKTLMEKVDRLKIWIVTSIVGGTLFATLLAYILKLLVG
jgi:hypothetical protein